MLCWHRASYSANFDLIQDLNSIAERLHHCSPEHVRRVDAAVVGVFPVAVLDAHQIPRGEGGAGGGGEGVLKPM